jgi:hypothetical protein
LINSGDLLPFAVPDIPVDIAPVIDILKVKIDNEVPFSEMKSPVHPKV